MHRKSLPAAVLLVVAAVAALALVFGPARYLEARLPGGLPLGNLIVAFGICAMAAAAGGLGTPAPPARVVSGIALVGALLWLPVSILLAGNAQLNFGNGRGGAWIAWTALVFAGACGSLLYALGAWALARRLRARDTR